MELRTMDKYMSFLSNDTILLLLELAQNRIKTKNYMFRHKTFCHPYYAHQTSILGTGDQVT